MKEEEHVVHPYIPNSVPAVKERMLKEVGAESVEEFYTDIPEGLRLREELDIPEPFLSEYGLRRHVEGILSKNKTCNEYLNFLGAGCWPLSVPATRDVYSSSGRNLYAQLDHIQPSRRRRLYRLLKSTRNFFS